MIISEHNRKRCLLFPLYVREKIVCDSSFSTFIYMETIQYCLFRYFCHSSKSFSIVSVYFFFHKIFQGKTKLRHREWEAMIQVLASKLCNEMVQRIREIGNTYAMCATIMHGIYFQWCVITTSTTTFHFMHSLQCRESHTQLSSTLNVQNNHKTYIKRLNKSRCQTAITSRAHTQTHTTTSRQNNWDYLRMKWMNQCMDKLNSIVRATVGTHACTHAYMHTCASTLWTY